MNDSYDLIVVGGGPAGTSAAITAARDGWRVLLLEKDRFPRHKVCGEFISAESLNLLRWLLGDCQDQLLEQAFFLAQSRLFLDGRTVRIPVSPAAASITRYHLDLALWNAARQEGVVCLQKTAVQRIETGARFQVATSAGGFSGRGLINASGRWSNLNYQANGASGSRWLGLKAHCYGEMERTVDLYFFDRGYCGIQPVRSPGGTTVLNVCALLRPGAADTFDDLLRCHPALESHSRNWRTAFPALSTFPVIFRDPRPVSKLVLNVGDAAGFVDPFVGDGISLALRGGNLAAQNLSVFLRGECDLTDAGDAYERAYQRDLRPVYSVSSLFRKFLGIPRALRAPFLAACEFSPRLAGYLVKTTRSRSAEFRIPAECRAQL